MRSRSVQMQYGGNDFDEISNYNNLLLEVEACVYGSDEFRMFGFKINKCPKRRSHDWTLCPFAHRGEKACRRDPRQHQYEPVACPHFRVSGECPQGQLCPYAHGIFEYWLHPAKYRTRVCNSGKFCTRKVCFFAHTPLELRFEPRPDNYDINLTDDDNKAVAVSVVESDDFLASLSGLKVADDMPWNVIKKIIASKDLPNY